MCNILSDSWVDCFIQGVVGAFTSQEKAKAFFEGFFSLLVGIEGPSGTSNMFIGRPGSQGPWQLVWDATFIGSLTSGVVPRVLLIAILILVAGRKFRATLGALGLTDATGGQKSGRDLRAGAFGILLAYPLSVFGVVGGNALAILFLPAKDSDVVGTLVTMLFQVVSTAKLGPLALIPVIAFVVGAFLVKLVFFAQDVLINIYILFMPVIIASAFSGFPVVEDIGKRVLSKFPALCLLAVPTSILVRVYVDLIIGGKPIVWAAGSVGMIIPIVFVWLSFFLSLAWLKMGSGIAANAITTGGAIIGSAAILGATGNPKVAAKTMQGNVGQAGMYAMADGGRSSSGGNKRSDFSHSGGSDSGN